MSTSSTDEHDEFDEESIIVERRNKNRIIIESDDDDDYITGSSVENSRDIINETPADSSETSILVTSTPDLESDGARGKSYFASTSKQETLITVSDAESENFVISDDSDDSHMKSRSKVQQDTALCISTGSSRTRLQMEKKNNSSIHVNKKNNSAIHANKKNDPFMTPRSKKPEIDSDSEDEEKGKTPHRKETSISFSDSDDDFVSTSDIIDDSFENESTPQIKKQRTPKLLLKSVSRTEVKKQPTLDGFLKKKSADVEVVEIVEKDEKVVQPQDKRIRCKRTDYNQQIEKIRSYEVEMLKTKNYLCTVKLANLPDKGQLLKERFESHKTNFLLAQERLRNMVVVEEDLPSQAPTGKAALTQNWTNIEAGIATVQPKTFGRKGLQDHNIQRALTADCLEQLHGSIKNCPPEEQLAEDPKGIKVPLMDHQKRALTWLEYRETQKPSGGILADDMGLGKTLTMIALVLKTRSQEQEDSENDESEDRKFTKSKGGTLIVCPASLIHQWAGEIDSKLKRGSLSYEVYHGSKRETRPKRLAEHDVVITTYSIAMNELDKNGTIFRVRWKRIILDEAHQIRNHKSQTSLACCEFSAKYRWALTGTPIHNKELDMYALLKFLRCSPFDDLAVWKRWVSDKNSGGGERLHTVISSLMLRRTKAELMEQGKLTGMPSRKWELVPVALDGDEMGVYHKVLLFSQTLFAQFLHQRAEKNQDIMTLRKPDADPNGEYFKMRQKLLKMNKMVEVSQHEILVLLLRLRQICCHLSLITNMLQGDEDLGDDATEEREDMNLLEQLNRLQLDDDHYDASNPAEGLSAAGNRVGLKEATKGLLNPSHPVFARDRMSSKIKTVMKFIPNIVSAGDKIIIVSQWTGYLELVGLHLKDTGIQYLKLNGSVPTAKRTELVTSFNDEHSRYKVLLLSLTAGGVGLNLVGANHLFLLDLHWNPQLENQAQDRIYRMGQRKDVCVYKFMASNTIEERIKQLQDNKLAIADNIMTGSKQIIGNKLSLQDLQMLFNM